MVIEMCAIQTGAAIGVLMWLFSAHLTQPGEIFAFWPGFVQRITKNDAVNRLLYGCAKCMSGFWALWFCLFSGYGLQAFTASVAGMMTAIILDRYLT